MHMGQKSASVDASFRTKAELRRAELRNRFRLNSVSRRDQVNDSGGRHRSFESLPLQTAA